MLDLHSRGSIGLFELHYFIRDVVQGLLDAGDEPTELENIIENQKKDVEDYKKLLNFLTVYHG